MAVLLQLAALAWSYVTINKAPAIHVGLKRELFYENTKLRKESKRGGVYEAIEDASPSDLPTYTACLIGYRLS
jgi:hypothetical protein